MNLILFDTREFAAEGTRILIEDWKLFSSIEIVKTTARLLQLVELSGEVIILVSADIPAYVLHEVVQQTRHQDHPARIIALTRHPSLHQTRILKSLQLQGLLSEHDPIHLIYRCLEAVLQNNTFDSLTRKSTLRIDQKGPSSARPHHDLTPRQQEVLCYLAEGRSVKEVAAIMNLSPKSVDSHKYRIMRRLQINDRVLLTRYAIREGLVDP
ncbi:MAG: response regulator transcription factor [Planctomycetaceae bacterium]|nr:response regulator transcription factor [Planctomycetaceae bacterium]